MTALVGAAAARVLWKALPYLLGLGVLIGAAVYVQWLRTGWAAADSRAKIAADETKAVRLERDQARAAALLFEANGRLATEFLLRQEQRDKAVDAKMATDLQEIAHAKVTVPVQCRPAFRPLDIAWRRMREARAVSDTADRAAHAGPVGP